MGLHRLLRQCRGLYAGSEATASATCVRKPHRPPLVAGWIAGDPTAGADALPTFASLLSTRYVGVKPQRVWALSGLDDQPHFSLAEACEPTEPPACTPKHLHTWSVLPEMENACRYPTPYAQPQTAWCLSFLPPEPGLDLARHAPSRTRPKGKIHRPVFRIPRLPPH